MSELNEIITEGEGDHFEFISQIDNLHETAKILVAFANSEGGKLLIGVKNNGKIVGANPVDVIETISDISNAYCKPPVEFTSKIWEVKHYLVLEITVKKSKTKHRAINKDKSWIYYIRSGNQIFQGNKIVEYVWNLEKFGIKDNGVNERSEKNIFGLIKKFGPVTLSQLYQTSNVNKSEVDESLSNLVFHKLVSMKMTENGTYYSASNEVNYLL